ncbi:epoxidase LasC [Mycobacteroides abscessus]|nr:epoxidase LasC [Mycobacteroides abscessus]
MLLGTHEMFNRTKKFSDPETFKLYLTTRPFLEFHVRQRVQRLGNVKFLDGHDVIEPMTAEHRITGVRVARRSTGLVTTLICDLVVDATGRTPRTQTFLDRLGFPRPSETRVASPVTYASQLLHVSEDTDLDKLTFLNAAPGRPFGGAIARCENDTVMMTLSQFNLDEPPTTFAEMITLAEQFVPHGSWRRYGRRNRWAQSTTSGTAMPCGGDTTRWPGSRRDYWSSAMPSAAWTPSGARV